MTSIAFERKQQGCGSGTSDGSSNPAVAVAARQPLRAGSPHRKIVFRARASQNQLRCGPPPVWRGFLVGLVAASSSCIAVTGGLLLSAAAKFNERYPAAGRVARLRPVMLFIAGRVAGYTILGGLLGVVGALLTPSPLVTALITIAAAVFMLIMGLDILGIAPGWMKSLLPRLPKWLSHRIMDAEHHDHPLASFGLGAATFFLPCGFTQALQLYALTAGSFTTGAMTMLAFALGTAPALVALGLASSSLKGKAGTFFCNFRRARHYSRPLEYPNGLAIAGYPVSFRHSVLRRRSRPADLKAKKSSWTAIRK